MASADESERINFLAGGLAGGSIGSGQGELRHAVASAARAGFSRALEGDLGHGEGINWRVSVSRGTQIS
eukprot:5421173-Ditylum_brightwellii.AAC.1